MVEHAGILDQSISEQWQLLADKQKQTNEFVNQSIKKPLEDGNVVGFFNIKLDLNRFFIDEGTNNPPSNTPKVEYGAGQEHEEKDLFEDSLEDALCVFKTGGGKDADLIKENEQ